jgi:hypothetical protein
MRSDQRIVNPEGSEVTQKDALPNLVRLGAGAGAVVFFSAQQSSRARPYSDLTRFHEILYAHLDLVDAEKLRDNLTSLLLEQFEITKRRANELQAIEDQYRERLEDVERRIEAVLVNPPWELKEPPTRAESEVRVRSLVIDLARELGTVCIEAWSAVEALANAEQWVGNQTNDTHADLQLAITSTTVERDRLAAEIREVEQPALDAPHARCFAKTKLNTAVGRLVEAVSDVRITVLQPKEAPSDGFDDAGLSPSVRPEEKAVLPAKSDYLLRLTKRLESLYCDSVDSKASSRHLSGPSYRAWPLKPGPIVPRILS